MRRGFSQPLDTDTCQSSRLHLQINLCVHVGSVERNMPQPRPDGVDGPPWCVVDAWRLTFDGANDTSCSSDVVEQGVHMRVRSATAVDFSLYKTGTIRRRVARRTFGVQPEVCHLNEGHAAFAVLKGTRDFMEETGQPSQSHWQSPGHRMRTQPWTRT